jgi:hypothetical protein
MTKHLSIAVAATLAGAYAGHEFILYAWLTATPISGDTLPTLQRRAVAWGTVFLAAVIVGLINLIMWWHKRRQNHQSNLSPSNDPH